MPAALTDLFQRRPVALGKFPAPSWTAADPDPPGFWGRSPAGGTQALDLMERHAGEYNYARVQFFTTSATTTGGRTRADGRSEHRLPHLREGPRNSA